MKAAATRGSAADMPSSAGERDAVQFSECAEALEEASDPVAACGFSEHLGGEGEREEGGDGCCAHGGQVAEAARQAAVAYGFGRVEVAAEVAVLEGKVCGDKDLGIRWGAEDGAVVTDAEGDIFLRGVEIAADLLNEG